MTLLMNASATALRFTLPDPSSISRRLLIDSADPAAPERELDAGAGIEVQDRSAMLFVGVLGDAAQ